VRIEDNAGRRERRALAVRTVDPAQMGFPHALPLARVDRERRLKHGKIETETIWLITSLSPEEANAEGLLELARAYWGIENGTHRPLDTVSDEDRCRVRHPVAATVLGLLRRLLHGEARGWARGQPRARDRTFPTFLARHESDRRARLRTVTTRRGGL
jgi:hypothetical protein